MYWKTSWIVMRITGVALLLAGFGGSLFAQPASGLDEVELQSPTCQTFQPDAGGGKDAYIKENRANERHGGDSRLRVKTDNGKLNRALL